MDAGKGGGGGSQGLADATILQQLTQMPVQQNAPAGRSYGAGRYLSGGYPILGGGSTSGNTPVVFPQYQTNTFAAQGPAQLGMGQLGLAMTAKTQAAAKAAEQNRTAQELNDYFKAVDMIGATG